MSEPQSPHDVQHLIPEEQDQVILALRERYNKLNDLCLLDPNFETQRLLCMSVLSKMGYLHEPK